MDNNVKHVVEIWYDEKGNFLYSGDYILSRIHAPKEKFIDKGYEYEVIESTATPGKLGGVLVEYILKSLGKPSGEYLS